MWLPPKANSNDLIDHWHTHTELLWRGSLECRSHPGRRGRGSDRRCLNSQVLLFFLQLRWKHSESPAHISARDHCDIFTHSVYLELQSNNINICSSSRVLLLYWSISFSTTLHGETFLLLYIYLTAGDAYQIHILHSTGDKYSCWWGSWDLIISIPDASKLHQLLILTVNWHSIVNWSFTLFDVIVFVFSNTFRSDYV